ncbi:MAG: mycofactocin system FadH/OYE family oxidoreductase 2 [Acidimicrobiia bacterium]
MTRVQRYPRLYSPIDLGPVRLANRLVFSAHLTNYAEAGRPSEQHAAYYARRAVGGAGLIITEEHSTHPTDWPYEKLIHGFSRSVISGYRRITDAVHAHGTPIFAQLNHNGGQASSMYSRQAVWAPSAVPDPLFREVPKAVSQADITEIVAGYALVAKHCVEGGFDGIELQCSHSSIVRGFLSPLTNHRDDGYGGTLERRCRLMVEIIEAVRETIGSDLALGVRICGDELIDGGTNIDDAIAIARIVEATGMVDYLNTSIGVATATLFMIEASMHIPPGYASFIPSAIRREVSLPVIGVGRFKDPLQAERAIEQGHCDLVGAVRAQIADPDFAAKARSGHVDDIRLCLSCNQECVGRMGLNRWLGCIENPEAGREHIRSSEGSVLVNERHAVVVGSGPGGLQAAISLARSGYVVRVLEQRSTLGGNVRRAALVPNRAEFGDLVRNQIAECDRLGVSFITGHRITSDELIAMDAHAIVIATGSSPDRPYWAPEADTAIGGRIIDVRTLFEWIDTGMPLPTGRVLVLDEVGFHPSTSAAEFLADAGCEVTVLTSAMAVAGDLGITLDLEQWWLRAHQKGIREMTDRIVSEVSGLAPQDPADSATLTLNTTLVHHPTGTAEVLETDWIVIASHGIANDDLYQQLAGSGRVVLRVGDALAPRKAHAAVIEGDRVARDIEAMVH